MRAESGFCGLLRRYPLTAFFAIAVLFSWAVIIGVLALGLPTTFWVILGITLGPTVAALTMTGVLEGWPGIRRLLGRLLLWRVGPVWYLIVLLGVPLIFILGTVFLPGAAASFDPLTPDAWLKYPWLFVLIIFVGGPLFEEIGWRGFALPRLEPRFGPLAGTIILGLLWAAWHYPQYMMPDWAAQNGGFNPTAVAVFTLGVLPLTVLISWVFNNTRGSLLIAVLLHATANTFSVYIGQLFPSEAASQTNVFLGFGITAILIIVLTRGRLNFDRYQAEVPTEQQFK